MVRRLAQVVIALAVLRAVPVVAQTKAPAPAPEVLTNETVVQMVIAKVPREVIQAKIQSARVNFDMSVQGLLGLYANKVPTDIMKAMMSAGPKKASSEVLTNQSVIQMVTGKLPKDVILEKIQATKADFDVTSTGLISLNANKVPKDIVKVMMSRGG